MHLALATLLFLAALSTWADDGRCKSIEIIGWAHNVDADNTLNRLTLEKMTTLEEPAKCDQARLIITAYIQKASARIAEANRVLSLIEKKIDIEAIGLEYSNEEWENRLDLEALKTIERSCPGLQTQFSDFRKSVDPAVYFSEQQQRVKKSSLIPLENAAVKENLVRSIASETVNFIPAQENLAPDALHLMREWQIKNRDGIKSTDAEIQAIIYAETKPAEREKLKKFFAEFSKITAASSARDLAMAKAAVASNKNMIILVGQAHVANLKTQINRICHEWPQWNH